MVDPAAPAPTAPPPGAPPADPSAPVAPVVPPATQIGTPTAPVTPIATPENAWKLGLDPAFQADPTIQQTASINDLAKRFLDTKKMVGADKIVKMGENITPDERRLWMKDNLGVARPDVETAYGFDLKDAHPEFQEAAAATLEHVAKTFFEHDIDAELGKKLVSAFLQNEAQMFETQQQAMMQSEEAALVTLKQELGQSYDHKIGIVKHMLNQIDPSGEATALLDNSRLGNAPPILKMLIKAAEHMGGDNLVNSDTPQATSWVTSPEQAKAEIAQLQTDKEFRKALTDKSEPGHAEAYRKWTELHKIQAGEQ